MIIENFSNSAAKFLLVGDAQFLLVGACGRTRSISCFPDDLMSLRLSNQMFLSVSIKKVFSLSDNCVC